MAGCLGSSTHCVFHEGFEGGLGGWQSDAAIGPEFPIEEFEWEFGISEVEAAEGVRSLRIWNEGDYDDGVTWGVHPVPVEPGQAFQATVTAQFWSESESFNTLRDAVMRLGPEPPATEEAFPHPGVNTTALGETPYGGLREPLWLADGWRNFASSGPPRSSLRTRSISTSERVSSGKAMRRTTSTISRSSSGPGDEHDPSS